MNTFRNNKTVDYVVRNANLNTNTNVANASITSNNFTKRN